MLRMPRSHFRRALCVPSPEQPFEIGGCVRKGTFSAVESGRVGPRTRRGREGELGQRCWVSPFLLIGAWRRMSGNPLRIVFPTSTKSEVDMMVKWIVDCRSEKSTEASARRKAAVAAPFLLACSQRESVSVWMCVSDESSFIAARDACALFTSSRRSRVMSPPPGVFRDGPQASRPNRSRSLLKVYAYRIKYHQVIDSLHFDLQDLISSFDQVSDDLGIPQCAERGKRSVQSGHASASELQGLLQKRRLHSATFGRRRVLRPRKAHLKPKAKAKGKAMPRLKFWSGVLVGTQAPENTTP